MPGFSEPYILPGLVVIPVLWVLFVLALRRKKKVAMEFSRVSFLRSGFSGSAGERRVTSLFLLSLLAAGLIITGLAGPHIPLEQTRQGANVVFVMDVSGSMQATDYAPTRLDAAKAAAGLLIDGLDPKDYAGIVTFESGAMSAAYLTPDRDRVKERLFALKPRTGPTALGDGLALGVDMASAIPNRKCAVILLSDGVGNAGTVSPMEAAAFAQERGVQVFVTGLGTADTATAGQNWFGEPLPTGFDEATLQAIASATGGQFYRSVDGKTLSAIYASLPARIQREKEETPIGNYLIFAALVVIIAEMYVRYGRRRILP